MVKIELTKEELIRQKQGYLVKETVQTKGWQEVLKPWLESKIHNSWVSPVKFKNDKEYSYANRTAWAFAEASQQVLSLMDNMVEEAEAMSKKEKGLVKDKLKEALR